ncbi:MAG: DUF1028 domain-containing protein [Acidobacteria bacterium]|nr:DUF1028 domain-containing protein [Acidobacteriota bacterium]
MRFSSFVLASLIAAATLSAAESPRAHTYSIVARDPAAGQLGVAVQSHWFSVGTVVSWAEAGVGAVATQSLADPAYGPLGLELMKAGRSATQALEALTSTDPGAAYRQVAMIDADGDVAAFTGGSAIAAAGHIIGNNFSVQANLMRNAEVWPAMAEAFRTADGDLADRMLAALEAAESAGGDIRGRQSAALLVVSGTSTGKPWVDRVFDVRVDDSDEPLGDLRRLVRLRRAYNHMNRGDELAGEKRWEEAMAEYSAGAALAPEIEELRFWVAVTLFSAGREEEALPIFREVFAINPDWVEVARRLPESELLPNDPEKLKRIFALR